MKKEVELYFEKLAELKTTDVSVKGEAIGSLFALVFIFPVFLLGFLTHFLPAFATKKLCDALAPKDLSWLPTYKVVGGLVVYPIVLILQVWVLSQLLAGFGELGVILKWAYIASIIPAGLVAEWFLKNWKLWVSNRNWEKYKRSQPTGGQLVMNLRNSILKMISS